MYPAASVILFTTLSGLGFGLLVWLGLDTRPTAGWSASGYFLLAFTLAIGGLVSSTFHLGHPERALKAFTQWRTSWLSREGVCAVAALLVAGIYAVALIFAGAHYPLLGWLSAALSLATVYTTSMIYAQLATIPRWNTALTPVLYLSYAVTGGALLSGRVGIALVLLVLVAAVQMLWWKKGDTAFAERGSNLGTATGLGKRGAVRSMEHPHTSPNYLMREFIYIIGRKHAQKLRAGSLLLGVAIPILLLTVVPVRPIAVSLAAISHIAGVAVSRWLFFAQAEHTVGIYYGLR